MSNLTHLLIPVHVFLRHFFHVRATSVLGHVQIGERVTLYPFLARVVLSVFVKEKIVKEKKNVQTRCSATSYSLFVTVSMSFDSNRHVCE